MQHFYDLTTLFRYNASPVGILRLDYNTALRFFVDKLGDGIIIENQQVYLIPCKQFGANIDLDYNSFREIISNCKTSAQKVDIDNLNHSIVWMFGMIWDYLNPDWLENSLKKYNIKLATNFNDAIVINYPEFAHSDTQRELLLRFYSIIGEYSIYTNFISNTALNDFRTMFENGLVPSMPEHYNVCYLGFDISKNRTDTSQSSQLPEGRFVIFVSSFEKRKNHEFLINLYSNHKHKELPKLYFLGKNAGELNHVKSAITLGGLENIIKIVENPNDEVLNYYLENCDYVLFPSIIEGFGMGIAEALMRSKPVICNDGAVFREASQGVGIYAKTNDENEWLEVIKKLDTDEAFRKKIKLRIQSFNLRDWNSYYYEIKENIRNALTSR